MDNQDYNSFYNYFEEKYKNNFHIISPADEELRLRMLRDFRKNAFLRFVPAILIISFLMTILYLYSVAWFIGIFSIINIFLIIYCACLFHNSLLYLLEIFLIPLMQVRFFGVSIAIIVPMIVCIKLFCNYREKWNKKFVNSIKTRNMKKILETFGNIEWLNNKNGFWFADLKASDLFIDFDIKAADDTFRGTYKEIPFKISETTLYKNDDKGGVRGDGSRNSKTKIFQGVIINFKINKMVENRTLVTTKHNKTSQDIPIISWIAIFVLPYAIWNAWGIFGKILVSVFALILIYSIFFYEDKNFQKVLLEDPEFNKIFNVYSSNQVEARYLLTTSFMERFKNLQSTFGAKIIKCSFYDQNKLMIAISTEKNLFEIGSLFKSVYNKDFMKQFYKELSAIYFLIDYFKLDERTGL